MRMEQDICGNISSLEVERQGRWLNNQATPRGEVGMASASKVPVSKETAEAQAAVG